MFRKLAGAVLLFFVAQICEAQNDRSNGEEPVKGVMSRYLDDGKIGNVKNLVRLRMNRTIAGYFGLSYERRFTRHFGLEVGGYFKPLSGFVFNDAARQLFASSQGKFYPGKTYGGICYMAYPKLYITGRSLNNGYYLGLRNYYSAYRAEITARHVPDIHTVPGQSVSTFFMFGSHQHIGSRYAFGLEMGVGYFKDSYKNVTLANYTGGFNATTFYSENRSFSGINMSLDMIFGILF